VKKDIVITAVVVVIVLAFAYGLANFLPKSPSSVMSGTKDAAATNAAASDNVIMRVNGEPITEAQFTLFIQSAPQEARQFYASPAGRRALADELVKLKVLEQEAGRMGITNDPEVKQAVAMATSQIAASRALEKLAEQKSEARLRSEYDKEKATAVSLRHIVVAYQGGQVPARGGKQAPSESAAMQKANSIAATLRSGANFAQTAQAVSDDEQSAAQGGNLGPVKAEMLPPEIAGVVTKLKPGQMSDPVKTAFGIHIFMVEQPSFEDMKPALTQRVRQQVAQEEVKRLQTAAKVDLDPKFFPPAPAAPGAGAPGLPQGAPPTGSN
jgi:parvulin-like peptidyl-prolyl isomerase